MEKCRNSKSEWRNHHVDNFILFDLLLRIDEHFASGRREVARRRKSRSLNSVHYGGALEQAKNLGQQPIGVAYYLGIGSENCSSLQTSPHIPN